MDRRIESRRSVAWFAIAAVALLALTVSLLSFMMRGEQAGGGVGRVSVSPAPNSSSTTPATATDSHTVNPPRIPASASAKTSEGAAAYLGYFLEVYNYSFASLDASVIEEASVESCKFCAAVATDVRTAKTQGIRYEGSQLVATNVIVAPGDADRGLLVNALVSQATGRQVAVDGAVLKELPASMNVRLDAGIRWVGNGWKIFAVNLPGKN